MTELVPLLAPRVRKVLSQLPYVPRTFALVWAAARKWTIAWALLVMLQGLLPLATVYLSRPVVDRIVAALRAGGGWTALRPALVLAAGMAAVLLVAELLQSLTSYVRTGQSELVQDHISGLIHQKSAAVDLSFYDSPDFYDHLHRARAEASYRPVALLENAGSLVQNSITLLAMGTVLLPYAAWLPAVLLTGTLPAVLVALRHTLVQHQWRRRVTADERRTWYYDWLLTAGEAAQEVRLFDLSGRFREAYQSLRRRLRTERVGLAWRQCLTELAANTFAMLVSGAATLWMIWRAAHGMATLGDLALFSQALQHGFRLMRSLLENMGQLYGNVLFLGNLFEFLGLEPRVAPPARPSSVPVLRHGIHFRSVTFRYPDSVAAALESFDLTIPAGQMVAVVGSNGAGKSTLIKLLARLYDPQAGTVEYDGADLRGFSPAELRGRITVLFQQPVHYSATVRENIALGDSKRQATDQEISQAVLSSGAGEVVERLPAGLETLLGKWFSGGTELSTGEWQRMALARAFLRQTPVLALDEPTSAMDPWAEAEWLARFRKLARGRTVLIITHRFSTAMHADAICVMEAGRILESGTHAELLAAGGRYARGWNAHRRDAKA